MKKAKKKWLSMYLVLTMIFMSVFGNLNIFADSTSGESITKTAGITEQTTTAACKVRIEAQIDGESMSLIPSTEIETELFDLTPYGAQTSVNNGPVALNALITALEESGLDAKDKEVLDSNGGSYISTLCGLAASTDTDGWMYALNDSYTSETVNTQKIEDGDKLVFYYVPDYTICNYAYFDKESLSAEGGESFTLNLKQFETDQSTWETTTVPAEDAYILVSETAGDYEKTKYKTDSNGDVTLKFDKAGTYYLTAQKLAADGETNTLCGAYCEVVVTSDRPLEQNAVVRIEGNDEQIIAPTKVPLESFDLSYYHAKSGLESDVPTAFHAIVRAMELNDLDPSSENVLAHADGSYIKGVNGLEESGNSGWMYTLNNETSLNAVNAQALSPEDAIVLYYTPDYTKCAYAYFDTESIETAGGEAIELTLNKLTYDENWNTVSVPCKGVTVTVDGEDIGYATDDEGKVILNFDTAGTYTLSAEEIDESGDNLLLAAYCQVVVTSDKDKAVLDKAEAIRKSLEKISQNYSGTYGDWAAMDMVLYGLSSEVDEKALLAQTRKGLKTTTLATTIERMIISMTAMGYDMSQLDDGEGNTVNALSKIAGLDTLGTVNGYIFALLAYDSGSYETADLGASPNWTREKIITYLLNAQLSDGSFALNSTSQGDVDVTAMAVSALAPYGETDSKVKAALDKAVAWLAAQQTDEGGFASYGTANSNSCAMVMVALVAQGIDPDEDSRFIKNGNSVLDALLSYRTDTGTFGYKDHAQENSMATEQSFRALVAYEKYKEQGEAVYIYRFGEPFKTGKQEVTLKELEISTLPSKTTYKMNEDFDGTGLTLKAIYSDDSQKTVTIDEINIQGFDSTTSGEKTVTAAFGGLSVIFKVTIQKSSSTEEVQEKAWIKVYDPKGLTYFSKQAIAIEKGETALSLLQKTGLNVEAKSSEYGIYVEGIEGLYEFDEGSESGWMYSVNGVFPSYSADQYKLEANDDVVWVYTRHLGSDVGNSYSSSGTIKQEEHILKAEMAVDRQGKMEAVIKKDFLKDALDKYAAEKWIIEAKTNETVGEVVVTFPLETMKLLKSYTNLKIELQTNLGHLLLDQKTLAYLEKNSLSQAKDMQFKIAVVDGAQLDDELKKIVQDRTVIDLSLYIGTEQITDFGGGQIKVTFPYKLKANEMPEKLMVYYLKADGALEAMTDTSYNEKTETVSFTTTHFSNFMIGIKEENAESETQQETSVENAFIDVSGWAAPYINALAAKGLLKGRRSGYFCPNEAMTRAEFVSLLARIEKAEPIDYTENSFEDIKADAWYSQAANWAYEEGLVKGTGKAFNPNKTISREEMAAILSRYLESKALELELGEAVVFSDAQKISAYAQEAVRTLSRLGIFEGDQNKAFKPKAAATRAEIAKILVQFMEKTAE